MKVAGSKSTGISERLSSPMLSLGRSSGSSSKGEQPSMAAKAERTTSSGLRQQFQLPNEGANSHGPHESSQREELNVIRTLADVHSILAEVSDKIYCTMTGLN